jgi:hypothetical protein
VSLQSAKPPAAIAIAKSPIRNLPRCPMNSSGRAFATCIIANIVSLRSGVEADAQI